MNGTTATVTVKASNPFFFGMQDLLNGELESQLEGQKALRDVKAEAQDTTTKRRTGFAIDYSGFEVK